jgi:hypothetical protein
MLMRHHMLLLVTIGALLILLALALAMIPGHAHGRLPYLRVQSDANMEVTTNVSDARWLGLVDGLWVDLDGGILGPHHLGSGDSDQVSRHQSLQPAALNRGYDS